MPSKPKVVVTNHIGVTAETHRLLKMIKERYGIESFNDLIWKLASEHDPDIAENLYKVIELEKKLIRGNLKDENNS